MITNSDPFLEMPVSSQNLYFHLGMNGDDDGFVQVKSVMRQVNASDDDLKVLLAKGFLIKFGDGVIVITAWKVNNEIRGDRYKPTYYQEHLKQLSLEVNRCYSLKSIELISDNKSVVPNDNQMTTKNIPDGDTGKVSIGKVSIGKVKKEAVSSETLSTFDIFWDLYNHKHNKNKALTEWVKINPELYQTIFNHVRLYRESERGKNFPFNPNNYLKDEHWNDEIISTAKPQKLSLEENLKKSEELFNELS